MAWQGMLLRMGSLSPCHKWLDTQSHTTCVACRAGSLVVQTTLRLRPEWLARITVAPGLFSSISLREDQIDFFLIMYSAVLFIGMACLIVPASSVASILCDPTFIQNECDDEPIFNWHLIPRTTKSLSNARSRFGSPMATITLSHHACYRCLHQVCPSAVSEDMPTTCVRLGNTIRTVKP